MEEIEHLKTVHHVFVSACGWRVTCDPAPVGTDQDFLVLVTAGYRLDRVTRYLSERGFAWEGGTHYQAEFDSDFMSWRRDDVNLIITTDYQFAKRHLAATHVCRTLNLLDKLQRIMVFQAVLYGNGGGEPAEEIIL